MHLKNDIVRELTKIIDKDEQEIETILERPKNEEFGDYAFPCFILSKELKKNPAEIATGLASDWNEDATRSSRYTATASGPYLNITIHTHVLVNACVPQLLDKEKIITETDDSETILIESPGPNTNKPLHLGHLRNMLLGSTLKNVLGLRGHDTKIVNVVNDRGIHICKSMLAYKKWGGGKTPDSEGIKPDHFVGRYYAMFEKEASISEERKNELETEAREMLKQWEQGDTETLELWKTMNEWVYEGFEKTYKTLDFTIEKNYHESDTYKEGRDLILEGVKKGVFREDETRAIVFEPEDTELGKKVMLRSDGTAVYITQDINMARLRYNDFSFDRMIYVVANEQEYHFKVLFQAFKALGFPFAGKCSHFSYGMVELPSGKMKSREGTVIDTDDLINDMEQLAREEVKKRYENLDEKESELRSRQIALSAIRFFFLKHDPLKNFVFDKEKSLSFEGETGPYVQYTHARISSILRKSEASPEQADHNLLSTDEDKRLVKLLAEFDTILSTVSSQLKPSSLCHYLIRVCQEFNSYYGKYPIIQEDKNLENARVALITSVRNVLAKGLEILEIEALERM